MDPLDRLLINLNFAWLLILQYFGKREVMFVVGAVVVHSGYVSSRARRNVRSNAIILERLYQGWNGSRHLVFGGGMAAFRLFEKILKFLLLYSA